MVRRDLCEEFVKKEGASRQAKARSKTHRGEALPAACYAYAPDPGDPSTWKLIYRKPDGSPDEKHLRGAVAALSPEGFRGRQVQIPPDDVAAVKARLAAAYVELGWEAHPAGGHAGLRRARWPSSLRCCVGCDTLTTELTGSAALHRREAV